MYWTIKFNIANHQDEYVKCLRIRKDILKGQANDIPDYG